MAPYALAAKERGHAVIEAFPWRLLADTDGIFARWVANFQVSPRNAFALSHVGEDCPGAVQFVTPQRLDAVRSGKDGKVEWLDEAEIARRLQILREDHGA